MQAKSLALALLIAALALPAVAQEKAGKLRVVASPDRAGVFVDGKYLGPASNFGVVRKYNVSAGEHEVRLSEPRYEDVVTKVTIAPGKTAKVSEKLKALPLATPPFGTLRTLSSDKFAAVYIYGKFMGHADEYSNPKQGLQIKPGEYMVKIVPTGAADAKEERVTIEENKVTVIGSLK
jgi:PEGA domain